MIFKIRRTFQARSDLLDIARYTLDTWGQEQVRAYMAELDGTIQLLTENPQSKGHDRSSVKPGLRSISHKGHYFIFYRVDEETVELVRILHQRRNWQRIVMAD